MAAVLSGTLLKSPKNHGLPRPFVVANFSTSESRRTTAEKSRNPLFDPHLAQLKRGTGGRSSFNGMVATVFGATGFLGNVVCNKLGKIGTQLIIPYRGEAYDARHLKLCGDLGQVLFFPYYLKDEESIRKAMYRSNVVINCIGREWETRNFSFMDVHAHAPRTIARLARECGVRRLIHMSALNSSDNPKPIILKEGSKFYTSKYRGELAVKEEYPDVTILRPAEIWGELDRFLYVWANFWRKSIDGHVSLWDRGEKTEKQPVYVGDVALAIVNCLKDPDTIGKSFDLVGPHRYRYADLVDYIFRVQRRGPEFTQYKRRDLRWDLFTRLKISLFEKFCSVDENMLTWERMERENTSDNLLGNPTLEDLGITPTTLESRIEFELHHLKNFSFYPVELGEFPPAEHPPLVQPIDETA